MTARDWLRRAMSSLLPGLTNSEDIGGKPWQRLSARIDGGIFKPHGMLGREERAALFWIGREYCRGDGHIVDAGACLGTTAISLASGLSRSRNPGAHRCRIYSYDWFNADEPYVAEFIARRFPGFRIGQSYWDIFRSQVAMYGDVIVPKRGDFNEMEWPGLPIEVLFVDLDKSRELHRKFLLEYYPFVIPGHGLIAHQDWFLSRHPWLHFGMEFLRDHVSVVDPHVSWCTRIFRLELPIPVEKLQVLASNGLGLDRELALLDQLIQRERGGMRSMMLLSKATHCLTGDRRDEAIRALEEAKRDLDGRDATLVSEFEWVRSMVQGYGSPG